jgi:hypothetical protein
MPDPKETKPPKLVTEAPDEPSPPPRQSNEVTNRS